MVNLRNAYPRSDPALLDKERGETTDAICRNYNLRHGSMSMRPDLINLGLSGRCSSAVGKISNIATTGQYPLPWTIDGALLLYNLKWQHT